ncbi:hypothetical protein [Campylobacter sp. RM16192]|uniref:hypothetical protein n=1 Tax=Campylobacter sp. RM16192 TaxID=1660080 RepID=UPI001556DDA6|nr:hypothetical protein [Campylobacter sp. RM16192]
MIFKLNSANQGAGFRSLGSAVLANSLYSTNSSNESKIYFDMNNDGFKERMIDWFKLDEGVLVNDINKNGKIDSGREILGNHYFNKFGDKSIDSFSLLKEFDTNKDGVINKDDNTTLSIWIDKNSDGKTNEGELISINDENSPIKSISVSTLDALLSGYDRNHDMKIDKNDQIYNYIYYRQNSDDTVNLYIYGDDNAKSFLGDNTTNQTILTDKGLKRVREIVFYKDPSELNLKDNLQSDDKNEHLIGNNQNNQLYGNGGRDILEGAGGDDTLDGGDGSDKILGGDGNDTVIGGRGNDRLEGGDWDDRYVFSKGDGVDVIYDLN